MDELCWIRRISNEIGFLDLNKPTTLFVDNMSAIHMLNNAGEGKTIRGKKHIQISSQFIQHIGTTIRPEHVSSCDQLIILTKPLSCRIFVGLREKIVKEEC